MRGCNITKLMKSSADGRLFYEEDNGKCVVCNKKGTVAVMADDSSILDELNAAGANLEMKLGLFRTINDMLCFEYGNHYHGAASGVTVKGDKRTMSFFLMESDTGNRNPLPIVADKTLCDIFKPTNPCEGTGTHNPIIFPCADCTGVVFPCNPNACDEVKALVEIAKSYI